MHINNKEYFNEYENRLSPNLERIVIDYLKESKDFDLGYRIQASAVFSSNIEGNTLDLNSYMNLKLKKDNVYKKKEITEIDDLINAYQFAQSNLLNEENFLKAHLMLSKNILIKSKRGKYRVEPIGVFSEFGLVYLAVEDKFVVDQMKVFFAEIYDLQNSELSIKEILYYSSLIHLRFVHIHPFTDENGRAARLLEKWFLTSKLGPNYWSLLSEKYYKDHQQEYYDAINLGVNFYELNYSKCIPFLLMLPRAFEN